jgi:hypothetical protein
MDELFGVTDFSGIEDVGLAGKHLDDDEARVETAERVRDVPET